MLPRGELGKRLLANGDQLRSPGRLSLFSPKRIFLTIHLSYGSLDDFRVVRQWHLSDPSIYGHFGLGRPPVAFCSQRQTLPSAHVGFPVRTVRSTCRYSHPISTPLA